MKSAKLPQTVKTLSDGKCPLRDEPKLKNNSLIMILHCYNKIIHFIEWKEQAETFKTWKFSVSTDA